MGFESLLDRIRSEREMRALTMQPEAHIGLAFVEMCRIPAPVTWFTDRDGETYVVCHHQVDPERGTPEFALRGLGFGVAERCPMHGDGLHWCCYIAIAKKTPPSAADVERMSKEFVQAFMRIQGTWAHLEDSIGRLLDVAAQTTGSRALLNLSFGERATGTQTYQARKV